MGRVTIQQVAAEAGVSAMTVSNFLSGKSARMQPKTRDRVSAAVDKLGYRPNRLARSLRTGRAQSIGLVVPSVANPFWGAFANELEKASLAAGYSVLLGNTERDPARELRYVEDLWDAGVRSIVIGTSLPSLAHLQPLLERGLRLVTFDRPVQPGDPSAVVSVSIDNEVGGYLAAQHLIDLGHTRISFVAGSIMSLNRTARYRGFRSALDQAGLEPVPMPQQCGQGPVPFDVAEAAGVGRTVVRALFEEGQPPTGIVGINDMTALGVCSGARELGLKVGEDLSVVGFDDIALAALWDPPLTTICQPLVELASLALREALTEGADSPPGTSVLLRPELIARRSTGTPPDTTGGSGPNSKSALSGSVEQAA
ncbi:MAG: LacI family DNA-binding transcriptional regulator [Arachnia sp.]